MPAAVPGERGHRRRAAGARGVAAAVRRARWRPRTGPARRPAAPFVAVLRATSPLTKPRIVELLLVTTVPAMLLAAGGVPSLGLIVVVLVGGALAAGAANALNCYLDRDIDQLMRRTARRPLPAHTVTPRAALIFGLTLAAVVGRADGGVHQPARHGAHRWRDRVLRPRLHAVAQADARRTTRSGAASAARRRCSSAGPRSPAGWPRRPGCCSRSCSSGSRRTSTRWR